MRKTAKNEENPRKSRVFRLASFLSTRLGGATRNRTGDEGFADLCLTAWLWRRMVQGRGIPAQLLKIGYENLPFRTRFWSGLRGSNPPPPPWQGGALPNELNPRNGASGRNRTNDTGIFSPLLYQLSYRGIQQGLLY